MQANIDPFVVSERCRIVPVVNGDGVYARAIERWLLQNPCDCLIVPLPAAFADEVLHAAAKLPNVAAVIQQPLPEWQRKADLDFESNDLEADVEPVAHFVPIDPCQAVIAAIRFAIGEHISIVFADADQSNFVPFTSMTADAYALRQCSLDVFATAMLPAIPPPNHASQVVRIETIAAAIHAAEQRFERVVCLCPLAMWPWLRQRYADDQAVESPLTQESEREIITAQIDERTLLFALSELPFATAFAEQQRQQMGSDPSAAPIDYLKHLLVAARQTYKADLRDRARKISPLMLNQCIHYTRNLTLLDRRLSPDFYSIITACKQIIGDQYAIHVIEAAKQYAFADYQELPTVRFGISKVELPDGEVCRAISRLDSPEFSWRTIALNPKPKKIKSDKWAMQWNPYMQCSWPPEDVQIESFRTRLMERAQQLISNELAQSEKFSSSIMDGIDIRETLRHWYDGDIYVKRIPPSVGKLDACVMLFDVPADPRDYPWRSTWFAEHQSESTLAFYASNFQNEMLGPGVAVATYGGAMFLYPPRIIEDIWHDEALDFADTMEERLIAGACLNAQSRQIVLLSPIAPTTTWRKIAKRFGKRLVHLPMSKFSDSTIQQLRMFHVLNGKQVRSYAASFIRRV